MADKNDWYVDLRDLNKADDKDVLDARDRVVDAMDALRDALDAA